MVLQEVFLKKIRLAMFCSLYLLLALTCQANSSTKAQGGLNDRCQLIVPKLNGKVISGQKNVDVFLSQLRQCDALEGAVMSDCALHQSFSFAGKDIKSMQFIRIAGAQANFSGNTTQASGVHFTNSNLAGADFSFGNFAGASFKGHGSSVERANFNGTTLDGATFEDVDMDRADLASASMTRVVFSPHTLPDTGYLAQATGLDSMRFDYDETALHRLRKEFVESGLATGARDVTLAIWNARQARNKDQCWTGLDHGAPFRDHPLGRRSSACFLFATRAIAFDATCKFGSRPWRPLAILACLALLWSAILTLWLYLASHPKVSLVFKTRTGDDFTIALRQLVGRVYTGRIYTRRRWTRAYAELALALTLSSVFNLPFKEVEVGRWLRMISARDYEFRTRGGIRTFTGVLSLLCFYLLALWVLVLFGDPFSP
jgi:aryl carrier-like protein